MNLYHFLIDLMLVLLAFSSVSGMPQDSVQYTGTIDTLEKAFAEDSVQIPASGDTIIPVINFQNLPLKDVLRGVGGKYKINVHVDDAITQHITIRFHDMRAHDFLMFVAKQYDLILKIENGIYNFSLPEIPKPPPRQLIIEYHNDTLSVDLKNEPLEKVVYALTEKTGKNVVLDRGVDGKITGFLQPMPFEECLNTLMKTNGFVVRLKDDVYLVEKERRMRRSTDRSAQSQAFWIDVQDSLITLEVVDADLNEVILEVVSQLGIDLVMLSPLAGKVNAQCKHIEFDRLLNLLFQGTEYTFRKDEDVYILGEKKKAGMVSTELIKLNHIKVEGINEVLPADLTTGATLQIIKEHNSLMVVGSQDVIQEVKKYIRKIDYPIPQILIEAIVVDYTTTDIFELGVKAGRNLQQDTSNTISPATLFFPEIDFSVGRSEMQASLDYNLPRLGVKNIGRLPEGFMLTLNALAKKGKANLRSVPQIATLNGHPAHIKIGTTQYYQLESYTPYTSVQQTYRQTSQRFEEIKAEISLEITPWVSASGEITTEILPSFSTPRNFDPKTPPTIDFRELKSTVRLRDGETIVLGGLIQSNDSESHDKVPILSDIPGIGQIFRNRSKNKSKTKLMIYITPHLMYSEDVIYGPDMDY